MSLFAHNEEALLCSAYLKLIWNSSLFYFLKTCPWSFRFSTDNVLTCEVTVNELHVRFYYKLGQVLLQSGSGLVYYKVGQVLLKSEAASSITKQGTWCYKIRAGITNWGNLYYSRKDITKRDCF